MTEPRWTPGRVIWRELMTPDLERATGFYGELFGWRFDTMPMPSGPYVIVKAGGKGVGGVMQMGPEMKLPPMWQSYVSSLDVDAACAAAKEHGGPGAWGPVSLPGRGPTATVPALARRTEARPHGDPGEERVHVGDADGQRKCSKHRLVVG